MRIIALIIGLLNIVSGAFQLTAGINYLLAQSPWQSIVISFSIVLINIIAATVCIITFLEI